MSESDKVRSALVVFFLFLAAHAYATPSITDVTPDPNNFTPVLLPLTTGEQVPGANGSLWRTELAVFNQAAVVFRPHGPFNPPVILVPGLLPDVEPGKTRYLTVYRRPDARGDGAFLWLPNPLLGAVTMSLRVRDVSQNAQSWGTAIPIVTHGDTRTSITLIDIPTDARYRATLRIYHWSNASGLPTRVKIFTPDNPNPISEFETSSIGYEATDPMILHPAYVQVDLLTEAIRATGPTIRVEIDNLGAIVSPPPPNIWAFVSITNNQTQQVTVVAPK